jgi:hypothetical protein
MKYQANFRVWRNNLLLLVLLSRLVIAQLGPDQQPPDVQWKKIYSEHFSIIVPEELVSEGQRVANTMEYVRGSLQKTMRVRMKRWPIVLSNRGAITNGYVAYLPRKSEWYTVPPQDEFGGIIDWYQLLAIHEGRHMAQLDAFDQGFNRLAGILMGEIGLGGFSMWGTPLWFVEGDAVGIETALSGGGRGRQPIFDMGIRTLLLSGRRYSYYKAYLGSYKDYCPNYYPLGYHLVTYRRRQNGPDVWSSVMQRSSKYSFWPFTFSRSMKKITGDNAKQTYNKTMDELEQLWQDQLEEVTLTPATTINHRENQVWTNYIFPSKSSDGSIIALKSGLADSYTLVKICPDGREKKLTQIGVTERISVNGDKVTWSEINPDPSWAGQSFSDLVVYDLKTKKQRQTTNKGKYFSPAMAPDGQRIAAVKFDLERQCLLVVLDAETGAELQQLSNPENYLIKNPSWSEDGQHIVYTREKYNLRALTVLELATGIERDIIPFCNEDITYPIFWGDYLLYDSPWSGIDNIYAVNVQTGRCYQVTSRKFGAFYPTGQDDNSLLFCDYQIEGLNIVRMQLDTNSWIPLEKKEPHRVEYYQPLIAQEQGGNILEPEKIPAKKYPVENYNPLRNSINIHSWYLLPLPPYVLYGFLSDDLLNTMQLDVQVTHHLGENTNALNLNASYAGRRPIIDAGIGFGKRVAYYTVAGKDTTDVWDEVSCGIGFRFPNDLSAGSWSKYEECGLFLNYINTMNKDFRTLDEPTIGKFSTLSAAIDYYSYLNKAYRDLYPRWGSKFSFYASEVYYSSQAILINLLSIGYFSGAYQQYFPGLCQHHSLRIRLGLERQILKNYMFPTHLAFARGYRQQYFPNFSIGSLDYALPLCYPDLALGSLLYLKRLRANLFYDYGVGSGGIPTLYRSTGLEFYLDLTPLTLVYLEFGIGIRYSYRIEDKNGLIEFILSDITF